MKTKTGKKDHTVKNVPEFLSSRWVVGNRRSSDNTLELCREYETSTGQIKREIIGFVLPKPHYGDTQLDIAEYIVEAVNECRQRDYEVQS